jgi:hypothetical protein
MPSVDANSAKAVAFSLSGLRELFEFDPSGHLIATQCAKID